MSEICCISMSLYWDIMKIEEVLFCRMDKTLPWYKNDELIALYIDIMVQAYDHKVGGQIHDIVEANATALNIKIQGSLELQVVLHCGQETIYLG